MNAIAQQRETARHLANATRAERAEIKRAIGDGTLTVAAVLSRPVVQRMKVRELLEAQRGWGAIRAGRALTVASVMPGAAVESLTALTRAALIDAIRDCAPTSRRPAATA